jgi:signal transduction histidine kinase
MINSRLIKSDGVRPASRFSTSLSRGGDLAFLIVVVASYISAATALVHSQRRLSAWELAVLVDAGGAYLLVGTYGFALCRRAGTRGAATTYFVAQLLLAATLIWLRGSAGELSLILLPLAGQSALVLPPAWMGAVCFLTYVTLVLPLILRSRWVDAVAVALTYGTGIVFVVVFTRLAASERGARAELEEANQRLREHAAQIEELATTKERNRLAREIHDSLGHYLTVVNVQIGAARAVFAQDRARSLDHLSKAQGLTKEGLAEVRRSVAALRASPTESRPLPEALEKLVEQWEATGARASLEIKGTPRLLTPQTELTFYRAAQEALTNVGKHARASRVALTLDYTEGAKVRLRVEDDGAGGGDVDRGFGLLGIRERAQLLGGAIRVSTKAGEGFRLEVELPT